MIVAHIILGTRWTSKINVCNLKRLLCFQVSLWNDHACILCVNNEYDNLRKKKIPISETNALWEFLSPSIHQSFMWGCVNNRALTNDATSFKTFVHGWKTKKFLKCTSFWTSELCLISKWVVCKMFTHW